MPASFISARLNGCPKEVNTISRVAAKAVSHLMARARVKPWHRRLAFAVAP